MEELLILPLFVLGVAAIVAFWNRAGRWSDDDVGTAVGNALETLNAALGGGEHLAALEYRRQVHDEGEQAGGAGPQAFFPGVRDDVVVIRPPRGADEGGPPRPDEAALTAVVEVSGAAVGRVRFRPLGAGAWRLEELSAPPDVYVRTARLLLAYLFEIEEAGRVELAADVAGLGACGFRDSAVTPETVRPPQHRFSLRLQAD